MLVPQPLEELPAGMPPFAARDFLSDSRISWMIGMNGPIFGFLRGSAHR